MSNTMLLHHSINVKDFIYTYAFGCQLINVVDITTSEVLVYCFYNVDVNWCHINFFRGLDCITTSEVQVYCFYNVDVHWCHINCFWGLDCITTSEVLVYCIYNVDLHWFHINCIWGLDCTQVTLLRNVTLNFKRGPYLHLV